MIRTTIAAAFVLLGQPASADFNGDLLNGPNNSHFEEHLTLLGTPCGTLIGITGTAIGEGCRASNGYQTFESFEAGATNAQNSAIVWHNICSARLDPKTFVGVCYSKSDNTEPFKRAGAKLPTEDTRVIGMNMQFSQFYNSLPEGCDQLPSYKVCPKGYDDRHLGCGALFNDKVIDIHTKGNNCTTLVDLLRKLCDENQGRGMFYTSCYVSGN